MLTPILSRQDVSRHLQGLHLIKAIRQALTAQATQPAWGTCGSVASGDAQRSTLRQATLASLSAGWTVVSTHTALGVRSLGQLYDLKSGHILAIMEADHLMTLRASIVGALAADVLARADAQNVAILGSGAAASSALKALRLVRSLERVWVYSPAPAEAFELARRLQTSLSMAISDTDSVAEAVSDADLVVIAEPMPLPDLKFKTGAQVTVLNGDINVDWAPVPMPATFCDILGHRPAIELSAVFAGQHRGRNSDDEVNYFISTNPPVLDLITAWHVYEGARLDDTLTRIDLWS